MYDPKIIKEVENADKYDIYSYKNLGRGPLHFLSLFLFFSVLLLAINFTFDFRFFINYFMMDYTFYYIIMAILLSMGFIYLPVKKNLTNDWEKVWWYVDLFLAILLLGIGLFLASKAHIIQILGWERVAPRYVSILTIILWALIIELTRRSAGMILTSVVLIFSLYPLFAEYLPGIFYGNSRPLFLTALYHILGTESAMGMLLRLFCTIMISYTVFGNVIVATGGGEFFLDLSLSILGRFRGGTAKVAVISSALFGSLSGCPITNVITTGTITIPAMKKAGYDSIYAAAVECCASTAGTFTPPVMGITAFIMASFLNVNYIYVAIAAALPISLYYLSLFIQIDAYAAKNGLRGLEKNRIPKLKETLIRGWFFIPAVIVLVYVLFFLRSIANAAYYASFTLLVLAQINPNSRFTINKFLKFIQDCGLALMQLVIVMIAVGFLLGSFNITGIGLSFPRELMKLAGSNVALMLVMCALASFIMGMGMTMVACYIFLSIVIAPALILQGLNPMAVHLFVLYCGMLSYITPPVALAAYPAALIANTSPMKVGFKAMRIGTVLFLLPFFFVYDPNLILHISSFWDFIQSLTTLILCIYILSMTFENYFFFANHKFQLPKNVIGSIFSGLLISGSLLLGFPGGKSDFYGLLMIVATFLLLYFYNFTRKNISRNKFL